MFLKYLDELVSNSEVAVDDSGDGEVETALCILDGFKQGSKNPVAVWKEEEVLDLPRSLLAYCDTDDGSTTYITSWQKFYHGGFSLSDDGHAPFMGGSTMMGDGKTKWRGMAKAAIYLRYSDGFRQWLAGKDEAVCERIDKEREQFRKLFEKPETSKMYEKWDKQLKVSSDWALPVVCRLSDGRLLVLGLDSANAVGQNEVDLDDDILAVAESLELNSFFKLPPPSERELVAGELHARSGMGRNAFGHDKKPHEMTCTEYVRLLGPELASTREDLLKAWHERAWYRVKVAPNPDESQLVFFPEGNLSYSTVQKIVAYEQSKQEFYEAQKRKREGKLGADSEEKVQVIADVPNYIPEVHSASIVLANFHGAQGKEKWHVMQIFSSVNLAYWEMLNSEFLSGHFQSAITQFSRAAMTGREHPPKSQRKEKHPSVFAPWTTVFTSALQRRFISVQPFWNLFQSYCKAFSTDKLIGGREGNFPRGANYLSLIRKLRRLQYLIGRAREGPLSVHAIWDELSQVENVETIKYGVWDPMNTKTPESAAHYVGDVYEHLWDSQKSKIDRFMQQSWQGTPEASYPEFLRGALVGIMLNELSRALTKLQRRFEPTQGRHPTTLRGDIIPSIFAKGIGLLQNLDKAQRFNGKVTPFIVKCVPESRRDTFNNGLVMGMAYNPGKLQTETPEEEITENE